MADYNSHLLKARENLSLLEHLEINRINDLDWSITIAFYSALHLMNAYLAKEQNWHYRSHQSVQNALNPFSSEPTALDQDTFNSYEQLYKLSRRARYLCDPDGQGADEVCHIITNKHHKKALIHLHKIMTFFSKKYGVEFQLLNVGNVYFNNDSTHKYFKYVEIAAGD